MSWIENSPLCIDANHSNHVMWYEKWKVKINFKSDFIQIQDKLSLLNKLFKNIFNLSFISFLSFHFLKRYWNIKINGICRWYFKCHHRLKSLSRKFINFELWKQPEKIFKDQFSCFIFLFLCLFFFSPAYRTLKFSVMNFIWCSTNFEKKNFFQMKITNLTYCVWSVKKTYNPLWQLALNIWKYSDAF